MTTDTPTPSLPTPAVAAVVIAGDAVLAGECLAAMEQQVYAPIQVLVVGGDDPVRRLAEERDALWRPTVGEMLQSISPAATFVWVLDERARPRPSALAGLLRDGSRVDASVIGSKILDAGDPAVLVSVGTATDVFDAPYSGLLPGEIDQSQYDVVRDVAAVSGTSMLIRRDLFVGLRGVDPLMAPGAAAIDLCQRARLRGARVVVAPSSEVLYVVPEDLPDWRERAGEIRAMLKVYGLLTLSWAVPLAFLAGLLESVVSPFLGRWKLSGVLAAWGWNLAHLPSAIRARFEVRRGRQVGDEELFRYQTGGSARLRLLWDETLERIRARFPDGMLSGFTDVFEAGQQTLKKPSFFMGLFAVLFAVAATRSVWAGALPVAGFSLPPPDSATAALWAYAGGWNPAGLGSPEVLHPSVGGTALVQLVLLGKPGLAVGILTLGAFLAGVIGAARLMRFWGLAQVPSYSAGMVMMGGPALIALAGPGRWGPVIAMGVIPWAMLAAFRPVDPGWRRAVGRVASVTVFTGVAAVFAPVALLVVVAAALVWGAGGRGRRRAGVVRALAGSVLALPILIPWLLYVDLAGLVTGGDPAYWDPGWLAVGAVVVAAVGAIVAGDRAIAAVGSWGALLAVLGAAAARAGSVGAGSEVEVAGLMAASLGISGVVGAAAGAGSSRAGAPGRGVLIGRVAAVAAVGLVLGTAVVGIPGRAGLPEDRFGGALGFTLLTGEEPTRVLVFGPAATIPGQSRHLEGLGYRVMDGPHPRSWDAYLNAPRLGDVALHAILETLLDGEVRRAGAALAPFGIGWVAFTEPSQLQSIFEAQLDLVPLRSFDLAVYRNEVAAPVAAGPDGVEWARTGTGFAAPGAAAGTTVRVAQNGDDRWGPGRWAQDDWASQIQVDAGAVEIRFGGYGPRRIMAIGALTWLGLLLSAALLGRWRRA